MEKAVLTDPVNVIGMKMQMFKKSTQALLSIFFLILFVPTSSFAQKIWNLEEALDLEVLKELVVQGQTLQSTGQSCRSANYVNSVKMFYLSAINFYDFIDKTNHSYELGRLTSKNPETKVLELNSCFIEASYFAVMPDVHAAIKYINENVENARWVQGALLVNWEMLKRESDLRLLRTSKMAASMKIILTLGHASQCDFKDNPYVFASGNYNLHRLFSFMFRTKEILILPRMDKCDIEMINAHTNDYDSVMLKKAHEFWGP